MSPEDVTRILVGKAKVGIHGLKAALEQAQDLEGRPEEEIAQALLELLRPRNYIPAGAQEEYRQAFLKEYKKARGEQVDAEAGVLNIKVLGPGCPSCQAFSQLVMAALEELALPAEVEHITDLKEIAALGVFGLPALIINDEVKAVGRLPDKETLKEWLIGGGT